MNGAGIHSRIRDDVERRGWRVVLVAEGDPGEPPFAYTIGLTRTFAHPELILVGLAPAGAHAMLDELGERVRGGAVLKPGDDVSGIIEGFACRIDAVDPLWMPEYVGQALAFYDPAPVRLLQALWPDRAGRFPSDQDFAPGLRVRQPWLASTWHFEDPKDVAAFATGAVLSGAPVLSVTHGEDGTWRLVSGDPVRTSDARPVSLGSMVDRDPTLAYLSSLPRGWRATRSSVDDPWERSPI